MADVSKLLFNTVDDPNFLQAISPTEGDLKALDEAKKAIRECLRDTFAALSKAQLGSSVRPRFFTQGSRAYKTLNRGAWMPPQQMDLDDGVYLPMSFLKGAVPRPSIASNVFFQIVDTALIALAKKKGWRFATKPTCARVIISETAHIDVPMYAIPDEDFQLLEKAAQSIGQDLRNYRFTEAFHPDNWDAIPAEKVLLAHREEDWKVSDPRKIHVWFVQAIELYGERLRRICRYLKAWRDQQLEGMENVSSILLMTCAFMAFEKLGRRGVPPGEHEAFLAIAKELPGLLSGKVFCIPEPSQRLDTKMSAEDRARAIEYAKELAEKLETTFENCFSGEVAISNMQDVLGRRFPNRPDLVKTKKDVALVFAEPRKIVAAPQIARSQSG